MWKKFQPKTKPPDNLRKLHFFAHFRRLSMQNLNQNIIFDFLELPEQENCNTP